MYAHNDILTKVFICVINKKGFYMCNQQTLQKSHPNEKKLEEKNSHDVRKTMNLPLHSALWHGSCFDSTVP